MMRKHFIFTLLAFLMTGAQCEITEVFAVEGYEAVLPCTNSYLSSSPVSIMWSKANKGTVWRKQKSGLEYWGASWSQKASQETRIRCPHSQFKKGDYSLQIKKVTEEDGGVYSCTLKVGYLTVENVVNLRIIKVTISPSVPTWGTDVNVTCSVTPWPYGSSVQWMLNNIPFEPQTTFMSDKDTASSVAREKATAKVTGNWMCVVRYKGKQGRAAAALSVKGIVRPFDDNTKVYAAVGSAVVLPCVFSADLNPSAPHWDKLKPGSHSSPAPGHLPPSFSTTSPLSKLPWDRSAVLKEVAFDDEGRYRCSGIVQGQRQTRTMQLVVAKIDSDIASKKKGSVTLTCQLSDTSDINYEWVHVTYDLNGTQSAEFIQKGKTLSISTASAETQGEWACRFYGKEGILGNITHHFQLMSGLSGQKSTGSSHHTAAVVGLSFLLLVLLLILAQMYKNHQRRKRIHQYPALETIVHTISNEREEREKRHMKK